MNPEKRLCYMFLLGFFHVKAIFSICHIPSEKNHPEKAFCLMKSRNHILDIVWSWEVSGQMAFQVFDWRCFNQFW